MPLDVAKLTTEMIKMVPVPDELTAAQNFANAWEIYFMDASVTGVPVGSSLSAAKSAMIGALAGMSLAGAGAAKLAAGIGAFWGVVATSSATLWIVVPNTVPVATPPPTIAGIPAALVPVFVANTAGSLPAPVAMANVAAVLHGLGGLGGIASLLPPAGPAVPTPIL
jgi:hypothetical protein